MLEITAEISRKQKHNREKAKIWFSENTNKSDKLQVTLTKIFLKRRIHEIVNNRSGRKVIITYNKGIQRILMARYKHSMVVNSKRR